ncbi:glycoside hydrolase family 3 C-terminal domain-containing protein, partial [Candidatus Saccharibacteria bacterium]|nr:glycoside hydrolase family 3 C-terminal domain-containing protein [Candidatus Saccharibacteria bacterium]
RILHQKFKAGLFEAIPVSSGQEDVGSSEHRVLARSAVAASAVLLKNEKSLLPLSKNSAPILIAGSGADNVGRQSGAWTIEWQGVDGNWMPGVTSILKGLREVAGTTPFEYEKNANFKPGTRAGVAIAVVSEKPYAEGFGDNPKPGLDKADLEVIERLQAISDNVIIIVISGRPLLISEQIRKADAVVAAWLPGSEGAGLADVLFGNQPFSAKLPLPWPASLSQVPISFGGRTNDGSQPLFYRGFGLSTSL